MLLTGWKSERRIIPGIVCACLLGILSSVYTCHESRAGDAMRIGSPDKVRLESFQIAFLDDEDDWEEDEDEEDDEEDEDWDDEDEFEDEDEDEEIDDENTDDDDFDWDGAEEEFQTGEILVLIINGTDIKPILDVGFRVKRRDTLSAVDKEILRLAVPGSIDDIEALDVVEDRLAGSVADFNHRYKSYGCKANCKVQSPYQTANYQLSKLIGENHSRAARIGLIDYAVPLPHPVVPKSQIEQRHFVRTRADAPLSHGLAVASVLVGRSETYKGIVPHARVFVAAVFETAKDGDHEADADNLVLALDWLMSEEVPVINMSLAGPSNKLLATLLSAAHDRGHAVVAAVGNAGPTAPPLYPAAYDNVIGVTAVDADLSVYRRANRGKHVDFAAPGVGIRCAAAGGSFAIYTGTSFAAPYVTAILAAELKRPSAGRRDALLEQARHHVIDLGEPGPDPIFGYGLIQPVHMQSDG